MRLLVTDLTEMHGGNYCVAGWNRQDQRMVRPLPNGGNWTLGLLQQHNILPGVMIDVQPTGQQHNSVFPHRTEDTPIDRGNIHFVDAPPINWLGAESPPASATLANAFGGHLLHNSVWNNVRQGVHVGVATRIGSLGAIELSSARVDFVEEFDKLKAILDDGEARYKLAVSSRALKLAWRNGGLQAVRRALPASPRFHVRVGLARAFDQPPGKCYLMVNGVQG